jgi:hypothetical protein
MGLSSFDLNTDINDAVIEQDILTDMENQTYTDPEIITVGPRIDIDGNNEIEVSTVLTRPVEKKLAENITLEEIKLRSNTSSSTSNITPSSTSNITSSSTSNITPSSTSNITPSSTSNITPSSTSNITSSSTSNITPSSTSNITPSLNKNSIILSLTIKTLLISIFILILLSLFKHFLKENILLLNLIFANNIFLLFLLKKL